MTPKTLYPNLLAEYSVGNGGHISTYRAHANVTEELMRAALYSGAELTEQELGGLCGLLGVGLKYLSSPELTMLDLDDKCMKFNFDRHFKKALELETDPEKVSDGFYRWECKKMIAFIEKVRSGKTLMMAEYHKATQAIEFMEHYLNPPKPRGICQALPETTKHPKSKKKATSDVLGIDSREAAEMVGKRHDHLLRDIKGYVEILEKSIAPKIGVNEFFLENTYKDSIGRTLPCYTLTRKGCEMVANKMTGEKGVLFTAAYITKFHEMEKTISTNPEVGAKTIEALTEKIKCLEEKLNSINMAALPARTETSTAIDVLFKTPVAKYTTTAIGKAFDISARAINRYLYAQGIIRPKDDGWVLTKKYAGKNYVYQKTVSFSVENGKESRIMTWWTAEGTDFIRGLLQGAGMKQKSAIEPYNNHGNRGKNKVA